MTGQSDTPKLEFDPPEFIAAMTDEARLNAFMQERGWSPADLTAAAEQVTQLIFARLWALHYRKTW